MDAIRIKSDAIKVKAVYLFKTTNLTALQVNEYHYSPVRVGAKRIRDANNFEMFL